MSVVEIIGGVLLLIASLFIVLVTLLQESKQQGMTSAIGGGVNNDSFYGKNSGRTREAKLEKLTRIMAIVFFVITLAANVVPAFMK